jgi:preprotein translocase subunit SecE
MSKKEEFIAVIVMTIMLSCTIYCIVTGIQWLIEHVRILP